MKNLAFKIIGNLSIAVHNNRTPTDTEVHEYCVALAKHDVRQLRALIFTDGGAPNSTQRNEVNSVLKGREHPTAVVSDDRMVRGIVTAFSWFNSKIRAFSPANINEALDYLGVPPAEHDRVIAEAKKLRAVLDESLRKAS